MNALTVILCGAESLSRKFGLSMLEALANSITITISVEDPAKKETFTYLEDCLSVCGAKRSLFTKNAIELTHQAAGGILRTVGIIAGAALLKAFMAKSSQMEAEHVRSINQR